MFTTPKDSLPISVVILTESLTPSLGRAIASVSWAAEVILVTVNSAITLQSASHVHSALKIIQLGQLTDFAAVRNRASAAAANQWVLHLDSDEVFEGSAAELQSEWLAAQSRQVGAISFLRHDYFYGKKLQWGELQGQWQTRLLDRRQAHFDRPVHEVVVSDQPFLKSHIRLGHFSHVDISSFMKQVRRYAQIEASERSHQGRKISAWQILCFPIGKALFSFFIRLAWVDGWRGVMYVLVMSWHSWLVRCFLYEKNLVH